MHSTDLVSATRAWLSHFRLTPRAIAREAGGAAHPARGEEGSAAHDDDTTAIARLFVVASAGLALGGFLSALGDPAAARWCWSMATAAVLLPATVELMRAIARREPPADAIAVVSMFGALALGEFLAAAVVAVAMTEGRALDRFQRAMATDARRKRLARELALGWCAVAIVVSGVAWAVSAIPLRALAVLVVATPYPLVVGVPRTAADGSRLGAWSSAVIGIALCTGALALAALGRLSPVLGAILRIGIDIGVIAAAPGGLGSLLPARKGPR